MFCTNNVESVSEKTNSVTPFVIVLFVDQVYEEGSMYSNCLIH